MSPREPVKLSASISGIRTSADGGFKIVFDVPESEKVSVMSLLGMRRENLQLEVLPE